MKRTFLLCIVFAILSILLISSFADGEITSSIEGEEYLRSGERFTVVYSISGTQCCGFQGKIVYNSSDMKLISSKSLQDGWTFELLPGGEFLSFSNDISNRNSDFTGGELFELVFEINDTLSEGDICGISVCNVLASNLEIDINIPDAEYKKECDPPISDDSTLSRLLVSGASLTPAFSPDVRDYSILLGVEYEITELELTVEPTSERATFEIIGNSLEVGYNTVVIRVTSESGEQSEYTISVKRNHSHDQPYSNDSRLSSITLSEGKLSPTFSPDIYEYIVYLPFETRNIDIDAEAMNAFARSVSAESGALEVGYNEFKINCVAEDTTSSEYKVIVIVMSQFNGNIPEVGNKTLIDGYLRMQIDTTDEGVTVIKAMFYSELQNVTYDIYWYRDGKEVAISDSYILSEGDKGHSLIAIAKGNGEFSGYVVGDTAGISGIITESPNTTLPGGENTNLNNSHTRNTILLICVFACAIFLSCGLLIGEGKGQKRIRRKVSEKLSAGPEDQNPVATDEKTEQEIEKESDKESEIKDGTENNTENNTDGDKETKDADAASDNDEPIWQ